MFYQVKCGRKRYKIAVQLYPTPNFGEKLDLVLLFVLPFQKKIVYEPMKKLPRSSLDDIIPGFFFIVFVKSSILRPSKAFFGHHDYARIIRLNPKSNTSILDKYYSRWSNSTSTSIHQFYDSALTRLRLQSFGICLDDEPQVRTPLCRNLPHSH